jgi:hypothetical protein
MPDPIKALHNYSDALRVAGTEEAAEVAWREFFDGMEPDARRIIDRADFEWMDALARHCFEAGWHAALRRSAQMMSRALERAA